MESFVGMHKLDNGNLYNSPDVAKRIKDIAQIKGISLKEILSSCELGANTFSHMYHGRALSFDSLARIADCLSVPVDYLLGRESVPAPRDEIAELSACLTAEERRIVADYIRFLISQRKDAGR